MSMHATTAQSPRQRVRRRPQRRPYRVLIVEDDVELQPPVERVMSRLSEPVEIEWAQSAPEAIARLLAHDFDLVLADFLLDERGSGFAVRGWCERHRPDVRFAMMSAVAPPDYRAAAGPEPVPFLPKPFSTRDLHGFLEGVLSDPPGAGAAS